MNLKSIRQALTVAKYEIRSPQARSLLIVWALMTILLAWAMSFGAVQISSGSSGVGGIKSHLTSEFAQALQSAVVAIMIDGFFFAEFLAYRTRQGFFGSNFQPGIRNCIAAASSREPEGSFR